MDVRLLEFAGRQMPKSADYIDFYNILHSMPFGATGARLLSQAVKELAAMGPGKRAVVSICADGGLGAVALLAS